MTLSFKRHSLFLGCALIALSACDKPLDYDLRGGQTLNTTAAVENLTASRPGPDARGIISYPGYQVAVARRGDTVASVASRIGANADELARYNGLAPGDTLRAGEVLALNTRVAEPAGGPITPGQPVDIASVAGPAISQAQGQKVETTKLPPAQAEKQAAKQEPVRHKVRRGETAYSISRLYNVSVKSLADWNGLDAQYTVREGQHLLIPVAVAGQTPPQTRALATQAPGTGSPTPVPPSAAKPLPDKDLKSASETTAKAKATPSSAPDMGKTQTAASSSAAMVYPVRGDIVREYAKGRNDGIDIAGAAGSAVKAADKGTVAAVTEDTNGVPIIVVKHAGDLLTIYSNVDKVSVKKGDTVARGQGIAQMRRDNTALHFEIRKGFDSVDPLPYLN